MDEPVLDWFPKRFGAGDMAGQGARGLLGRSNLNRAELLVREMAQNSWDARLPDRVPRFELHLRTLATPQRDLLRVLLRSGDGGSLGLQDVLAQENVRVIEVHDRATKGLGGPVRNDVIPEEGECTDFADFVLTLGAPRDRQLGGGTFGFGKTAAYTASSCGTVLIWTRTRTGAGPEHRFIVSAFGDAFDMGGRRYTGRHWWGRVRDDSIEPITGVNAASIGGQLYATPFGADETGTSLMILAPRVNDDATPEDVVEAWRQSVMTHLWPKVIPGQPDERTMNITLRLEHQEVPLFRAPNDPLVAARNEALEAVRSVQSVNTEPAPGLTRLVPIVRQRPRKVLGHLAITLFPARTSSERDEDQAQSGEHGVILMRHDAELVVKELAGEPLPSGAFEWTGVFKPTAAADDAFAASEPPSHDDWAPGQLPREQRLDVRYALDAIQAAMRDFVSFSARGSRTSEGVSAGQVSTALAALTGGVGGGRATGKAARPGGVTATPARPRAAGTNATATSWELSPPNDSQRLLRRQTVRIVVRAPEGDSPVRITPVVAFGAEGSSISGIEDQSVAVAWEGEVLSTTGDSALVNPGSESVVWVETPSDVAIDIGFRTEPHS